MTMEYIRDTYKVPASVGGRVEYTGGEAPELGTINGANGGHLRILLDGESHSKLFHPAWELRYLPDNAKGEHHAQR